MSKWTRQSPRRRAFSAIYFAVLWLPLASIALLFCVEWGMITSSRSELTAAADAASMAGASGLMISPVEARIRAKQIAAENKINGVPLTLMDTDIEIGKWDDETSTFTLLTGAAESTGNSVRINARLAASRGTGLNLLFKNVLTQNNTRDISRSAIGAITTDGANDLVLVQDVTGSFTDEIGYARDGDHLLLDALYAKKGSTRFGIAAFTGNGREIAGLTPVVSNYATLSSTVDTLSIDGPGMPNSASCTDIAAGLERGIKIFDNATASSNVRSIVLVSDGQCVPENGNDHPGLTAEELLAKANEDADIAWSKKIHVYVVFWDSDNDPVAAANLSTLIRGEGEFLHVTDVNSLASAIGRQVIRSTRLVK